MISSSSTVAAVDCGPRSGFAWGSDGVVFGTLTVPNFHVGWPLDEFRQVEEILRRVVDCKASVVVIEDFILRLPVKGTQREGLSSARIGFALALELRQMSLPVVWQQPVEMKLIKGRVSGRNEHERDAVKHLKVYWRKQSNTRWDGQ